MSEPLMNIPPGTQIDWSGFRVSFNFQKIEEAQKFYFIVTEAWRMQLPLLVEPEKQ